MFRDQNHPKLFSGRRDEREEGRKSGGKEERREGGMKERRKGREEGRMDGREEGRKSGRMEGWKCGAAPLAFMTLTFEPETSRSSTALRQTPKGEEVQRECWIPISLNS